MERRFTVGDVAEDISKALAAAIADSDLVLVSGGLGPTPDDVTKGTVAGFLGRPLVVDADARAGLEARYAQAGLAEVPLRSVGQAEIPVGSRSLHNPEGTAPGILIEQEATRIVLLPGVPRELRAIFDGELAPLFDELLEPGSRGRAHHRVVHTTGIAESKLAEALEALLRELPPTVTEGVELAYLPDLLGVDLRFTTSTGTESEARERFDRLLGRLDAVLAPWRFDATGGDLAEAVTNELLAQGLTLATAESCTGGLVAKRMTDKAGSAEVFVGGVVAYANAVKVTQLGVGAVDIERDGSVSEAVAAQLALGAAERLGADAGIGITGVAGPGGGSEEKPVGTVWIGTALRGNVETCLARFPGDREAVRSRAAQAGLDLLYRRLVRRRRD